MAAIHWLDPISGSFTNPADWSGGAVPGAADQAILDATGAPYTVTSTTAVSVASVDVGVDATLAVTARKFIAGEGAGAGADENAGIILVGPGATFVAEAGVLDNSGAIDVDGAGGGKQRAALRFDSTGGDLKGGGAVILGGRGSVLGFAEGQKTGIIINYDNTLSGSGRISGGNRARLINRAAGEIDANGDAPMVINLYLADYGGLVEATGSGGLSIHSQSMRLESYATLLAGDGSAVRLDVLELLADGTFKSDGSGVVIAADTGFYAGGFGMTNQADLNLQNCHFGNKNAPFKLINDATIQVVGTLGIGSLATFGGSGDVDLAGGRIIGIPGYGSGLTLQGGAITGAGAILAPQGSWGLTIAAGGRVDNATTGALTLGIGSGTIDNAGTVISAGPGGVTVTSALDNTGTLIAEGGTLAVGGAVTGAGVARIDGGTLDLQSGFDEAVSFTGATGELVLAQSQAYSATIKGFSRSRGTVLDLADIAFVSASEASFSGTAGGGVLSVSDGTHTAAIHLAGDFLTTTFTASDDGHGGVQVIAKKSPPGAAPASAFVAAMAGLGVAPAIGAHRAEDVAAVRAPVLFGPGWVIR